MTEDESQSIERLLASLDGQDRATALRVLEREALLTAPEISSLGNKKMIPEEPQKDSQSHREEGVKSKQRRA